MYDEFTSNFGMIQLPLNNDLFRIENKKFKRKFNLAERRMGVKKKLSKKKINDNFENSSEKEQDENEIMGILKKNSEEIYKKGFGIFLRTIQNILKYGKNIGENNPPH